MIIFLVAAYQRSHGCVNPIQPNGHNDSVHLPEPSSSDMAKTKLASTTANHKSTNTTQKFNTANTEARQRT
jgi:hypothetical protein